MQVVQWEYCKLDTLDFLNDDVCLPNSKFYGASVCNLQGHYQPLVLNVSQPYQAQLPQVRDVGTTYINFIGKSRLTVAIYIPVVDEEPY